MRLNSPSIDFSALARRDRRRCSRSKRGGAALARDHRQPLVEGYGLTEASPVVCINPFANPKLGTVGLPVPSTEVSIRDDDGNALAVGESGEVWVRGPQVMQGYWQRPDETAQVLTADGWLQTGDIGAFDSARISAAPRPQEGHDHRLRLQGVSQ